jgi:HAE1 family hydrophobic/amphiphilic exporter-1
VTPETDQGGLFRFVATHPVAVLMVFAAALVFGYVSYDRLPVELMPDISYPTVTVRTAYDGAAPEEVEQRISLPVEQALATLDQLVTLESRSRANTSDVLLAFRWGADMPAAVQSIRESLQQANLPREADKPLILRYDPSLDPFLRLALSMEPTHAAAGDEASLFLLREVAERDLGRVLEGMDGVAAVRVRGGLEREIRVAVRQDWLAARSVTLEQVEAVLRAENVNLAGGSVLEGDTEYLVRTLNELRTLDEIRGLRIRRADGETIPLGEVAEVTLGHQERDVVAHLDGAEAVEIEIFKEADANVVSVARAVKEKLFGDPEQADANAWMAQMGMPTTKTIAQSLPEGVRLELLDDQAAFIEQAIANLQSTAIQGGVLAVAVLFLFLRSWRATGVIGVAIPASIIIGFGPLYVADVSLNLMSLGGLALGVGMLVDNSVVVLEAIERHLEAGRSRLDAAVIGAQEVAAAVTSSTLTTVAVFLPIAFVEGVAGVLFRDLALAVTWSLAASLAVALFLVPMLAALSLPSNLADVASLEGSLGAEARRRLGADGGLGVRGVLRSAWSEVFTEAGARRRASVLRRRGRIAVVPVFVYAWLRWAGEVAWSASGVLVSLVGLFVADRAIRVGGALLRPFLRLADRAADRFQGAFGRLGGWFDRVLDGALRRRGEAVVAAVVAFGLALAGASFVGAELIPELHQGRFAIQLRLPVGTPLVETGRTMAWAEQVVADHPMVRAVYATAGSDRASDVGSDEGEHIASLRVLLVDGASAADEEAAITDLRAAVAGIGRGDVKVVRPAMFSFATPVEVVVFGYDLAALRSTGDAVAAALSDVDGLRDVRSSIEKGFPEIQIKYDRDRLARIGIDPATVASQVRSRVQGAEATQVRQGDQRLVMRVQLVEQERRSVEQLRRVNVNPSIFPTVPLEAVADLSVVEGPSEIRRVDQQRAVVVSANLEDLDLGSVGGRIGDALSTVTLPEDSSWVLAGQVSEMQSSSASLWLALGLAVFLVYVIMAATFESLVQPVVILVSVPLAVVGVSAGLVVSGTPVSVVVFIGMIVLAGVVVNNAIVLVDATNRLRDEGRTIVAALGEASRIRLRPILVTTTTTVLGLLPLAFGFGEGAEVQRPLAITVIAGLTVSTVLTLVVVPVLYAAVSRDRPAGEV